MQLFEERERNLKNMLKALNHMKDLYQDFTTDVTSSRIVTVIASKPAWRKKTSGRCLGEAEVPRCRADWCSSPGSGRPETLLFCALAGCAVCPKLQHIQDMSH